MELDGIAKVVPMDDTAGKTINPPEARDIRDGEVARRNYDLIKRFLNINLLY